VFGDFAFLLTGFGILGNGSQGDLQDDVFAIGPMPVVSAPTTAHDRLDVLAVLEVKEGPTLVIPFENDVPATAAIASVWTSFGNSAGTVEVGTARPSFA
jgi:hypothetical protein